MSICAVCGNKGLVDFKCATGRCTGPCRHGFMSYHDEKCKCKIKDKLMSIQDAVKVLVNELKKDASYRETWKANIAMMFKDQWSYTMEINSDCVDYGTIHEIANKAADRFLDNLTR